MDTGNPELHIGLDFYFGNLVIFLSDFWSTFFQTWNTWNCLLVCQLFHFCPYGLYFQNHPDGSYPRAENKKLSKFLPGLVNGIKSPHLVLNNWILKLKRVMFKKAQSKVLSTFFQLLENWSEYDTPRSRAALFMCLKKHSAIGNSAIRNYVVLYCKLILKTVLLEVSYGKND